MYGATIGQVGILGINSTTNQAICAIIPNEERAIPEYIYAVLRGARSRFVALGAGGAQPNISQQIIKNFEIPLPPINVQKQIVEEFITEQEISSANQKLVELYEQKIQETLVQIGA
jgi:restriction endonuclease S subunit